MTMEQDNPQDIFDEIVDKEQSRGLDSENDEYYYEVRNTTNDNSRGCISVPMTTKIEYQDDNSNCLLKEITKKDNEINELKQYKALCEKRIIQLCHGHHLPLTEKDIKTEQGFELSTTSVNQNYSKEKEEILLSLRNETLLNEEQRAYIEILKQTIESSLIQHGLEAFLFKHNKELKNENGLDMIVDITKLKGAKDKLEKDLQSNQNMTLKTKNELESFKTQLSCAVIKEKQLQLSLSKEAKEKNEALNKTVQLINTITTITSDNKTFEKSNRKLLADSNEYQLMNIQYKLDIDAKDRQISSFEDEVEKLSLIQTEYDNLVPKHQELQCKYDNIITINNNLQSDLQFQLKKTAQLSNQIKENTDKYIKEKNTLIKEICISKELLSTQEKENQQKQSEIMYRDTQIKKLKVKELELKRTQNELKNANKSYQELDIAMKDKVKSLVSELKEGKNELKKSKLTHSMFQSKTKPQEKDNEIKKEIDNAKDRIKEEKVQEKTNENEKEQMKDINKLKAKIKVQEKEMDKEKGKGNLNVKEKENFSQTHQEITILKPQNTTIVNDTTVLNEKLKESTKQNKQLMKEINAIKTLSNDLSYEVNKWKERYDGNNINNENEANGFIANMDSQLFKIEDINHSYNGIITENMLQNELVQADEKEKRLQNEIKHLRDSNDKLNEMINKLQQINHSKINVKTEKPLSQLNIIMEGKEETADRKTDESKVVISNNNNQSDQDDFNVSLDSIFGMITISYNKIQEFVCSIKKIVSENNFPEIENSISSMIHTDIDTNNKLEENKVERKQLQEEMYMKTIEWFITMSANEFNTLYNNIQSIPSYPINQSKQNQSKPSYVITKSQPNQTIKATLDISNLNQSNPFKAKLIQPNQLIQIQSNKNNNDEANNKHNYLQKQIGELSRDKEKSLALIQRSKLLFPSKKMEKEVNDVLVSSLPVSSPSKERVFGVSRINLNNSISNNTPKSIMNTTQSSQTSLSKYHKLNTIQIKNNKNNNSSFCDDSQLNKYIESLPKKH